MKCVSCKEIVNGIDEYGTIQEPLCFDCHMDCRKWCELCEKYTSHSETNMDVKSGYCIACYEIWSPVHSDIMADIQAVESDLSRQYMQSRLLEFNEVKS